MDNIYNWKEIGQRIKEERKKKKLTQQELADKIFISSRQTIANWENGSTKPQLEDMICLCNIFQCELGYLLAEPDYNCRTQGMSYIQEVTGLSEKAIEYLIDINKIKPIEANEFQNAINGISRIMNGELADQKNALDYLLSHKPYGFFTKLHDYLFYDYNKVIDGRSNPFDPLVFKVKNSVFLGNASNDRIKRLDKETICESMLMSVTDCIRNYRKKIQKENQIV